MSNVKQYRKKPVIIEAMLFDGENYKEAAMFIDTGTVEIDRPKQQVLIPTLEGTMAANKGDYIIKGVQGEFYPCKPDIFEQTYEAVEDNSLTERIETK